MRIIGLSQEMVEKITAEHKRWVEEHNKYCRKHNLQIHASMVAVGIIAVVLTFLVWRFVDRSTTWGEIVIGIATVFLCPGAIALIVYQECTQLFSQCEFRLEDCKNLRYTKIVEENNVIEEKVTSISSNYPLLTVVLENKETHVVTEEAFAFPKEIRTNIDDVIVDMEKELILVPYPKREDI